MPRLPWFAWVILVFIVLNGFLGRDIGFFPIIVIGFVLARVAGSQRRTRDRLPPQGQPHHVPHTQEPEQPYQQPPVIQSPPAEPMPTIDVPRYPGGSGAQTSSSLGSDPSVSFAQLQLGEAGRSLEQAVTSGHDAGVEQALRRLQATVDQVRPSLEGVGSPQARTLRASLDGLGAASAKALAQPPGPGRSALVERVLATCRAAS